MDAMGATAPARADDVPLRRLLVAVDFSPPSLRAVAVARRIASAVGATVTLVHAARDPHHAIVHGAREERLREAEARAAADLDELARAFDGEAAVRVVTGEPAAVILDGAEDADLVVMGTHGRSGLERLVLGSVAARVLRDSPVPVLAVPLQPLKEQAL